MEADSSDRLEGIMSVGNRRSCWLVGIVLAAAGVAACGDAAGPDQTLAECLAAAGATGTAVAIRGFAFLPDTVRVAPGTRVTWVNCEPPQADPHTATADDGAWGSELLFPGDVFSRDFTQVGTFPYHCVPHPHMRAVVIVEAGA